MSITASEIDAIFRESFPARSPNEMVTLDYVSTEPRGDNFAVVMRLMICAPDPGGVTVSIRDIKKQELYFEPGDSSLERLQQYAKALLYVLGRALDHRGVDVLMPHDLFITNVLKLAKARTDVDFVRALSVKSRLGKYLPAAG